MDLQLLMDDGSCVVSRWTGINEHPCCRIGFFFGWVSCFDFREGALVGFLR